MGNSALIVVIASVLSGIMILLNIQRINTESNIVQTHMEEEVLARELAHTGLSLALANIYTDEGVEIADFELNYQGGFIDVDNFVNSPENQQLQFDVFSEFGGAQYLIHSRYQYEANFPFAMYMDVPNLNLLTEEESTIYGGPDVDEGKFFLGTSEYQRLEDQEGLSGPINLNDVENNINNALDDAWDGLPGEITEVSILDSEETFSDQLPDIDPDQNNPWLQEFYFQTLDNMNVSPESQDAYFEGPEHLFGTEVPVEGQSFAFGLPASTAIVRVDGNMIVKDGSTVTGHGILLVEGDLIVESGAALDWNGIVYLRPETTHSVTKLDGAVNINGAIVAYQEALPPGSHMGVTTNRDLSGRWSHPRGIYDDGPKPIPGPWFVHRHKWNEAWQSHPPVSIEREVIYRTDDGTPTHEYNLRFNETMNAIAASGVEEVQLEFVNPGQSGMGIYAIKFADSPEGLPITKTIANGFNGSRKSNAFKPGDLTYFSIYFRSLRMLQLMRDPKGIPFADDGPHRVTDDHNRQGAFHLNIRNAKTDELLYSSTVYQHIREDESDEFEEELGNLRDQIEAGEFGLTIDMGPNASIRYDNLAASTALGRTNFTAFALVGTWTQRCSSSDFNCDLTLNR